MTEIQFASRLPAVLRNVSQSQNTFVRYLSISLWQKPSSTQCCCYPQTASRHAWNCYRCCRTFCLCLEAVPGEWGYAASTDCCGAMRGCASQNCLPPFPYGTRWRRGSRNGSEANKQTQTHATKTKLNKNKNQLKSTKINMQLLRVVMISTLNIF